MPRRNNRRKPRQIPRGNGGGATRAPRVTMMKRFQYVEQVKLTNATSLYAYMAEYKYPELSRCKGALNQFTAYELWRLCRMKVSIQLAGGTEDSASQALMNDVANTTIWTASDFGANEYVSGEQLMQYQNAKRNTLSLNRWTPIVDTSCHVNCSLKTVEGESNTSRFILPRSTWINTQEGSDSKFYSGYQLFIQNFANQSVSVNHTPTYQLQTELWVEFKQPGFQSLPTTFSARFYDNNLRLMLNEGDTTFTELTPKSIMESRQGTIITYEYAGVDYPFTPEQIIDILATNTADSRFGGRRAQYDGTVPYRTRVVQTPPFTLIGTTFDVPSIPRSYSIVAAGETTVDAKWGSNNIDVVNMSDIAPRIADGTYTNWSGPDVIGW